MRDKCNAWHSICLEAYRAKDPYHDRWDEFLEHSPDLLKKLLGEELVPLERARQLAMAA